MINSGVTKTCRTVCCKHFMVLASPNSTIGSHGKAMSSHLHHVTRAQALDGEWYSLDELVKWYGVEAGTRIWNEARADPERGGFCLHGRQWWYAFVLGTPLYVFMDAMDTRGQDIHAGDTFRITGPRNCWYPAKIWGWQPRAWTSFPGDPASRPVRRRHLAIDFSRPFVAIEVRDANWDFRSARVRANTCSEQEVWINIASKGIPWVQKSR